jgi:hypothetical protein
MIRNMNNIYRNRIVLDLDTNRSHKQKKTQIAYKAKKDWELANNADTHEECSK